MEDKNLYNKVMLIALCLIVILLCAGIYSYVQGSDNAEVPRGKAQVVRSEAGVPPVFLL
nr:hypothetical protein [uncultured Clostridium sp.]